jgi:hypothetical protein
MDRKRKIAEVGRAARADLSYWEWDKQYLVIYGRLPPFISHKFANLVRCNFILVRAPLTIIQLYHRSANSGKRWYF